MSVTGYLALYTTLLGWQAYDGLWTILCDTGLVYLPFIGIVVASVTGPFLSMGAKDAAIVATRRLTVGLISALMVIEVAGVPTETLDPSVLHYQPLCVKQVNAKPGDTGTTFDKVFTVPQGVKVPLLWSMVMSVSNGFTEAANTLFTCKPLQTQAMYTQINTTILHNPQLQQAVSEFYQQCYQPSYATYMDLANMPSGMQQDVKQSIKQNGASDVAWLGSKTFTNVSGFYDVHQAQQPIAGFPFDATRDSEEGQVSNHSQWGEPSCQDWWTDPNHGLQAELIKALPVSLTDEITHWSDNPQQLKVLAMKRLLTNTGYRPGAGHAADKGFESMPNSQSGVFSNIGTYIGMSYERLAIYPKLKFIVNALPLIQGLLLFGVYMMLAVFLPFSKYSVGFCVSASFIVFTLISCSFIWHGVMWLSSELEQAFFTHPYLSLTQGSWATFFNMLMSNAYWVFPGLWMVFGSIAGMQVGGAVTSLLGQFSGAAESGSRHSVGLASSAVNKVLP